MNTCKIVAEHQRAALVERIFGVHFPVSIEPAIYRIAAGLSDDYKGGFWDFWQLPNQGFYMAPRMEAGGQFRVQCENGYCGKLSADAFGIICCLYGFSNLSFSKDAALVNACTEQFHTLREFALDHAEAGAIFRAID